MMAGVIAADYVPFVPLAPSKFIAVGTNTSYSGTNIQISTNGVSWNSIATPNLGTIQPVLNAICTNGSRWVAVGYDNNTATGFGLVLTSDNDGYLWTSRANPFSSVEAHLTAICFDGVNFIAVGDATGGGGGTGTRVMTSPDGITWTARTSAPSTNARWFGIAAFAGGVVAVGRLVGGGIGVMTSANNGVTWTQRIPSVGFSSTFMAVADDGQPTNTLVAVSQPSTSVTRLMSSTNDGVNWTARTGAPSTGFGLWGVRWNGSVFVAVGGDENASPVAPHVMTSPTGITWTQRTPAGVGVSSQIFRAVAVALDGQVVAVGHNGGYALPVIQSSPDGLTGWSALTPDPTFATAGPFFGVAAAI